MFKRTLPLLLLFLNIFSVQSTSLSSSNCPTTFSISSANSTVSSSVKPLVTLLYSNLYSPADAANLRAAFANANTETVNNDLVYTPIIALFATLAAAFAITFGVALCCCIFEKSCPPCKSWKRDFSTRPYEKFEMTCVTVFALIFAVGITITTILGFVFFPQLSSYITATKCGLFTALDVAINGDQSNGWGGFSQLANQVGNVSTLLSTASTAASANLANNGWLLSSMAALQQQNINIYTKNHQSTVYSPDPIATQTAISGSSALPTVTPLFIAQGLGPNGTANTMVTSIDAGLRVTAQISNQGYKVYSSAQLLANSANSITVNTNVALQSMTQNSNYLDAINASLSNFSKNVFDSLFNWGLYLIQGILGFIMAASLLIILGILGTHWFQLYSCKTLVHLGWVAYGVTYFGVIALCFIFFSFGGVSYQFCEFYGSLINSNSSFNSYAQITGPAPMNRFFQKISTCFYGDGNILSQFAISQQMETVNSLYSHISTYLNMVNPATALYVNPTTSTTNIQNWITAIQKYQSGIYIDADPALTSEQNPYVALSKMNKFTNNGNGGTPPSCTNDYWVFDNTNCTLNATETVYVSTSSSTSGSTFASTGTMCVSLNEKFQTQKSTSWSVSDIANRYVGRRQCNSNTQSYTEIIKYATSLTNYRDSRINLYQDIQDQLNALLTANQNFNTNINTFTSNVNAFVTATQTLQSLVTNQVNGLTASSNCTTIANNLRFVYNTFCVNFLYTSVQFGICCLTLLGIMIGGTLTGCVFGVRYGRMEKDIKAVRPETPSVQFLHSETFEKKNKSSESSSSSDED